MATSYLVQEVDGTSRFVLEDASGDLLLETSSSGSGLFAKDFSALPPQFIAELLRGR